MRQVAPGQCLRANACTVIQPALKQYLYNSHRQNALRSSIKPPTIPLLLILLLAALNRPNAVQAATLAADAGGAAGVKSRNPMADIHLVVPPVHTALSGELPVQITTSKLPVDLHLILLRIEGITTQLLTTVPIVKHPGTPASNTTIIKLPCGLFTHGGQYFVRLVTDKTNVSADVDEIQDIRLSRILDVRWPLPKLTLTPENIQTYPEGPVTAILEFPEVVCPPTSEHLPVAIPEFWLELHFCGPSLVTCDVRNGSVQVLYSEQVRGFPGKRVVSLRCELFGLAGHYALVLRPTSFMPSVSNTAAYLRADWSEQFVFNVHARSIFPCDAHGGGVPVLFQYPACILESGDRVRLYARLRADVTALVPPTTLGYVAEQRVTRGQHSLHFDCDLFTERYVEYCFVYVSQAITGAVADVRMDCVPTLPVGDGDTGGWGPWSQWTQCTTTCSGGTRNRYRFCDSPAPRYGAKFCEGPAVETEKCGTGVGGDWECMYGASNSVVGDVPADRPEVRAEIGLGCRCGCVVHLGLAKPRRLVGTSSQSCPGRTFWLIMADDYHVVHFKVDHFRLPCGSQWLKIRDGNSLSATMISQLVGSPYSTRAASAVTSTGRFLLLEFFSDEVKAAGEGCGGGFLAHAQQIVPPPVANTSHVAVAQGSVLMTAVPAAAARLTVVHVVAFLFVSIVFLVTAVLVAQYLLRYRKYHIAEDMDSFADMSVTGSTENLAVTTRAASNSTLLSEVISLTRLRPKNKTKHMRLRESMDCEQTAPADHDSGSETPVCDDSVGSTTTLRQEKEAVISPTDCPNTETISVTETVTTDEPSLQGSVKSLQDATKKSPSEQKMKSIFSSENILSKSEAPVVLEKIKRGTILRRPTNISTVTLTNGCYSPAAGQISTATIRTTSNPKESKEKKNRERLLAGPGSEFSLSGQDTELEFDYYDYNVVNAGAAPGSYLGMDPAFLVWIPPLDDSGEILEGIEDMENVYPKQCVDPGSNQESPDNEVIIIPNKRNRSGSEVLHEKSQQKLSELRKSMDFKKSTDTIIPTTLKLSDLDISNNCCDVKSLNKGDTTVFVNNSAIIPMQEFSKQKKRDTIAKVHQMKEKETRVEKSPSDEFYDVDASSNEGEIKFADDDEDELGKDNGKEHSSYHDINILSSKSS